MGENTLSMDQVTAVLDHMPVAIYVSRLQDCELLYANSLAKELFFQSYKTPG